MLWDKPPSPEELKARFSTMAHAFELDAQGEAFMQDFDLPKEGAKPISALLIDTPGGKTVRDNLDHFVKRDRVEAVCHSCATLALFTMQANAPAGGAGYRVGLRGGGPLTTLLSLDETNRKPHTLWHTLWLNVLPEKELRRNLEKDRYNWTAENKASIFPWLGPTLTSEKNPRTCSTAPGVPP